MTMESGKEKPVKIWVTNNKIHYNPSNRDAHRGDEIVWTCEGGSFAIQFLEASPVELPEANSNNSNPVKRSVRADAQAGTYWYACAVYVGNQVYLDANCPAIIID